MTRNPYAPSAASVESLLDQQPGGGRPAVVTAASVCLATGILISLVRTLLIKGRFDSALTSGASILGTALALILAGLFIFQVLQGRNWARIVVALLIVTATVASLGRLDFYLHGSWVQIAPVAVIRLCQLAALPLLFSAPARRWFRKSSTG